MGNYKPRQAIGCNLLLVRVIFHIDDTKPILKSIVQDISKGKISDIKYKNYVVTCVNYLV